MCHCSRCRKATGSVGKAILIVPKDRFRRLSGEVRGETFAIRPTYMITRCKTRGTPLPAEEDGKNVYITAGTLDEPLGAGIKVHLFCASGAEWDRDTPDVRHVDERST